MNNFAQENNLQCYPNLCGPTLRKGIYLFIYFNFIFPRINNIKIYKNEK